ncbi:serine acetyl transferase [Streptococcus porcinus]|uniref:hypothetical protein n=1 Tax=Streptococcus porcinus TaxID=1340 RepID=UPI0010CAB7E0|nr:hypothetical protein [Streptococcus porcinus]VTS24360.1 serine acetyl transferase [Streptococcus porcinus]
MKIKTLLVSLMPLYGLNTRFRILLYLREYTRNHHLKFFSCLIKNYILSKYSCELSIHAQISPKAEFMHTTGVVIGEGAVIKEGVKIYSNVVLGRKDINNEDDYPIVNENVILSTGTVVLGKVNISSGVVIGANSLVFKSLKKGTWVGAPAKQIL